MKKTFLGVLVASAVLASCSSEEPVVNGSGNEVANEDGRYITFNIVTGSIGTRAATEGEFVSGTGNENKIENAVFLFFDENGNSTQTPVYKEIEFKDANETNPNVEKVCDATVVIAGSTQPTYAIAVLNAPSTYYETLNGKNLTDVTTTIRGQYSVSAQGKFVMSNSVYFAHDNEDDNFAGNDGSFNWTGAKLVNATDITGHTYETEDAAKNDPCNIYVERVTAKVTTTAITDEFAKDQKFTLADGTEVTLRTKITGMEIANVPRNANLIKNMTGWETWKTQWAGLNDYANRRSYWAYTAANSTMVNQSWTQISDKTATNYQDPTKAGTFYVLPNTIGGKDASSILLSAQLVQVADGVEQDIDLLRWGGQLYLKDGFLKQLASQLKAANFVIYDSSLGTGGQAYRDITVTDLAWLTAAEHASACESSDERYKLEAYEMAAKFGRQLGDDEEIQIRETDSQGKITYKASSITAVNNTLRLKANRVWIWEDGKCYYFANIEHFGVKGEGYDFSVGTVRNHVYQLTLNSLTGLGTPVYNPDEIIIPEKPDDKLYYMAAVVKVLKWKIVNQTVDFGK